jgi:hypothetical protein
MKEVLCHTCNFPAKRGRLPIIWPGSAHRAIFCSVKCAETAGVVMRPSQRAAQLIVEATT